MKWQQGIFWVCGGMGIVASCGGNPLPEERIDQTIEIAAELPTPEDTAFVLYYGEYPVNVRINYPECPMTGTMLILQGWNFPDTDWCDSTSLCEKALGEGYALVCPDMGKSIYAYTTYPETREDWLVYPTRRWMLEQMFPELKKHRLFERGERNVVVGLSTGARGAFLLALDLPDTFSAVACLSGDYDQRLAPGDNLYRGYFGTMSDFPERWSGKENPCTRLDQLKASVYLGHGSIDKVVNPAHTAQLAALLSTRKDLQVQYHLAEGYGHDYRYWSSEVDALLHFMKGR